jgi:hypothetical protein
MTTILITGFGPFPGAPVNPTTPLVRKLARLHRPGLGDVRLVGHVFATSYAAVDRELPQLIARHKPDALLMFGVATRERRIRIETRAQRAGAPAGRDERLAAPARHPARRPGIAAHADAGRVASRCRTKRPGSGLSVARRRPLSLQLYLLARRRGRRGEKWPAPGRLRACAAAYPCATADRRAETARCRRSRPRR